MDYSSRKPICLDSINLQLKTLAQLVIGIGYVKMRTPSHQKNLLRHISTMK